MTGSCGHPTAAREAPASANLRPVRVRFTPVLRPAILFLLALAAVVGVSTSADAAKRRDLLRDEKRGGHTLARHVGLSDAELRERLRRDQRISAASTYTDRATAEEAVAAAIKAGRKRIDQWVSRDGSARTSSSSGRGAVVSSADPSGGEPRSRSPARGPSSS